MRFANIRNGRVVGIVTNQPGEPMPDVVMQDAENGIYTVELSRSEIGLGWFAEFLPPLVDLQFSPPPAVLTKVKFIVRFPAATVGAIMATDDERIKGIWEIFQLEDDIDLGEEHIRNGVDAVLTWLVSKAIIESKDLEEARKRIFARN